MTKKQSLQDFYRSPKLYVQIPSGGTFYNDDVIDWPETNELPILGMTPKDEMIIRNPDALLNGDAVLRLIKSCVPNIKKPEDIIAPDMELLLVAIRAASEKDKTISVDEKCPKCEHENSFSLDLSVAVQDFEPIGELSEFNLSNGLTIAVKPANYLYSVQTAKQMIEQANNLASIGKDEFDTEDQRLETIGNAFEKMAQYNYAVLVNSIRYIKIPDSDVVVNDYEEIVEFVDNVESKIGKEIDQAVSRINNGGINKIFKTECENCGNELEIPVDFDPVTFFLTS
jgi:hypothetical protein